MEADDDGAGLIEMNGKERERLRVVQELRKRRLRQGQTAWQLGLSVRQVKRLVRAHRTGGAPSNRRIDPAERQRILELVAEHYPDFGPTLAAEYLRARHGFEHSVETLRQWLIGAGRHRPKRRRQPRVHQTRERRAQLGELVQIDGSPHAWLEDRAPRCTLIAFVDDATSRLLYARFAPAETKSGLPAWPAPLRDRVWPSAGISTATATASFASRGLGSNGTANRLKPRASPRAIGALHARIAL